MTVKKIQGHLEYHEIKYHDTKKTKEVKYDSTKNTRTLRIP